jgi:hypothetical protein
VNNSSDLRKCETELGKNVKQSTDRDYLMSKFTSIINANSHEAFWASRYGDRVSKGTSVDKWIHNTSSWWTLVTASVFFFFLFFCNCYCLFHSAFFAFRVRWWAVRVGDRKSVV